ncbi:MAG: hypothetical protein OXE05_01920 [Chloroflexi bacterium]|nr:hypothetical protein [Chloroflexota bacterium]
MLPSEACLGKRLQRPFAIRLGGQLHLTFLRALNYPCRFDREYYICYHDAPEEWLYGREPEQKGCHVAVLTVQIGQAALVGNQRRASSPWAHTFQDTSSDVDMGSLYLNLEGVSSETAGTIANEVARHYFENTSARTETALLRSVRHAYRFLYDARIEGSLSDIGLTAVVVLSGRASIAQVLPAQFYLVQEGELTALPETQERASGQNSPSMPDDRYPQWEPPVEMFRATLHPQDVVVLCSDNVGTALSDNEVEEILSAGNVQNAAESLVDSVRKRGEKDCSALVLRFDSARETLGSASTAPQEPEASLEPAPQRAESAARGGVATSIVGLILALFVMTWSFIASLFRPRSQPAAQSSSGVSSVAMQSTITTRNAVEEARRQRINRVGAGIVVLLVLALLVIGANALFGGEEQPVSITEDAPAPAQEQETVQAPQSDTGTATASPAPIETATIASATPSAPESTGSIVDELQEIVRFDAAVQPGEIFGLNNTMYVLDRASGAVYRVGTAGNSEVVYQPNVGTLSGSNALLVTGRADLIQILDSSYQLYQVVNGEAPQVAQLSTGSILDPRASATYDQNFYLLDAGANDVLRFRPIGSGVYGEPEGFFGINSGVDLSQASDLAIDGSVFILFSDGTINRYTSGSRAEFSLETLPSPLGTPGAIFISQEMGSLYILDGDNDRVVQVTTEGVYQRQILAPNSLFATAIDLYVNRGETYLWIVGPTSVTRIPLPELPADAPRSAG